MKKKSIIARKPGRPTVKTPEMAERLCEIIGRGIPFSHACPLAGISISAASEWRATDEDFATQLKLSESQFIAAHLDRIAKAAIKGSWTASAWMLERCHPEHFGRNRLEVQHHQHNNVAIQNNYVVPKEILDEIAISRTRYEQQKLAAG